MVPQQEKQRRRGWVIAAGLVVLLAHSSSAQTPGDGGNAPAPIVPNVRFNPAPSTPDGEWHSPAHDWANSRFSTLNQIDRSNVARLKIAWTFSDGTLNGHEAPPLVVGSTMYVVTPFPNVAYALDLTKPGVPTKWVFQPNPKPIAIGKACCDTVNRGMAYVDGKIVYNLLDGNTVAVDANTGKQLWRTKLGVPERGETMTMAPLIAKGKVFVGISGGEMGVRGYIAALDVNSGKELWRAYSTGPDKDVRIDANFKPFYDWMKGKDLGVSTWPASAWKQGAGGVWAWISYDPDLNLVYYGTSNPGPRVPAQRPGLNLWTSTIFARDADTGMAKWAYQFTPHDQWDYDGVNENLLVDMPVNGQPRKVLVHLDRNGYGYTLDRTTGEVLVAKPFGNLNWSTGFDMKKGMPIVDPKMQPKPNVELHDLCPPDIGVKDWQPSAVSPRTGLVYAGIFNICMNLTDHPQSYIPGTPYDGMEMERHAGPGGNWGEFIAWDAATGKRVWSIKEKFMVMSGALVTAGDVVFYGTVDGWFRAVDAFTGKVLWTQKLGSGIIGQPMTFVGPDKRQYVAIAAGVGGAAMVASTSPGFPPRGSTLYVFSLDGASPSSGETQLVTDAAAAAAQSDHSSVGGRR